MTRKLTRLSEHLRCVALTELPWERCVDAQWQALSRFGPVVTHRVESWDAALELIQPLRTFPRYYIVASFGRSCLVVTDMIGEPCLVDVLFHSALHCCRAVGGIALQTERRFFYIDGGEKLRDVECFAEGRWRFRERGVPIPAERPETYARRRVAERLTQQLVFTYLGEITGVAFPLQPTRAPREVVVLERSWREVISSPEELFFTNDVRIHHKA